MNFRLVTHYLIGSFLIFTLLPSYADDFNSEPNQPEKLDSVDDYSWFSPITDNEGFMEGSRFKIFTRNWFENNEMRRGQGFSRTSSNGTVHKSGYARTWTQGTQFIYESGFTQGVLGVGVDISPFVGIKLDGGGGHAGFNSSALAHKNSDGTPNRDVWSKMGVYDIKFKLANSTVKVGQQMVHNAYLDPHDNKTLPPTFNGVSLVSNDIKHLVIQAGSFNRVSRRADTSTTHSKLTLTYASDIDIDRFSYLGGDWTPTKDTKISLYGSEAQEAYRQYYFATSQSIGDVKDIKWTAGFSDYLTKDHHASSQVGHINNNTWSAQLSAQKNAHTLMLGYQEVDGDEYFDYLNETSGIYLANSMDVDYNAPHEKSLQLRYGLDMGYYGVSGLNLMAWVVKGWGLDGTHYKGPMNSGYYEGMKELHGISHHEFGFVADYKIPDGKLKDVDFKVIYMVHRGPVEQQDGNMDTLRIITEVPFNIF